MPILPWRTDADGYRFSNSWTLDPTERAALAAIATPIAAQAGPMLIPIFPPLALDPITMGIISTAAVAAVNIVASTAPINYGMCGGMAYSSCDYWHAKLPLPCGAFLSDQPGRTAPVPTAIRNMIWSRLLDSLSGGGALQTTLLWSLILNQVPSVIGGGAGKLNALTAAEWTRIKATIDSGNPCPIGLLYTNRDVWDQHQILVYGYDDFGTHGKLYVYDNNDPHGWGDDGHTSTSDIVTFDFTGPALKAASPGDGPGTLAGFFKTNYVPKAPPANLAAAYGQFLAWTDDKRSWEFAYGALLPIADNTELTAVGGTAPGICATGTTVPVKLIRPRDNGLLREHSSAPVFLYEGGCPFHVPDPATLNLFGGFGAVRLAPDKTLSKFMGPPDNGTLLRETSSAHVFQINNGIPTISPTPATNAGARVVFDGALDSLLLGSLSLSVPKVTMGSGLTGTVHLKTAFPDRDLIVTLASTQPNYVTVPASVTILKNNASANFAITTHALAITSNKLVAAITATLGETPVSALLALGAPRILSFAVSPNPVTAGQTATATITTQSPYPLPITVALKSYDTGFATVPASVTIPANTTTVSFTVTAVASAIPFAPAKVDINASYADVSADCNVTVNPSVVAGTVKSLTLSPNPVTSGGTTHGTVTLLAAVTTPTNVGLMSGLLSQPSPIIANMPASITINPGLTQGSFPITVKPLTSQATMRTARITAVAVSQAFATLTVS
ncbi:MAG TPA: hypothetical protein VN734_16135 [Acidobacteriaceae bacterium]|nr:hypothetical protein [Acidobacteriaceae bacterium]